MLLASFIDIGDVVGKAFYISPSPGALRSQTENPPLYFEECIKPISDLVSSSGFNTNAIYGSYLEINLFMAWMEEFPTGELLFAIDVTTCHNISTELAEDCVKFKIDQLQIPPNTSLKLQPLDEGLLAIQNS